MIPPSSSGGKNKKITVLRQSGQMRPLLKNKLVWWFISITPATWEVEVGKSWSRISLEKSARPYPKSKLK
jgi:hypothetical protein